MPLKSFSQGFVLLRLESRDQRDTINVTYKEEVLLSNAAPVEKTEIPTGGKTGYIGQTHYNRR